MFNRRRNVESPHQQTCQWIFDTEQYTDWSAGSSGLLWVKGKPGAGKSTLMAHMYRHISQESSKSSAILLEFFFNARGTELEHSRLGLLRSLMSQLFLSDSGIKQVVRDWYTNEHARFDRDYRKLVARNESNVYGPELEPLLTQVILESAQQQQIIIFIDALDEAGEESAREVARYLHMVNDRVQQASAKAKICLSCRHYPIPSNAPAVEVCVEDFNGSDITAYVQSHLNIESVTIADFGDRKEWQRLTQSIVDMANGVFQWVRLVVPMVEKGISDGQSHEEIRHWLSRVPRELEMVYKHILENVIDQRYRKESLKIFQWVCLAQRRLSLDELRHALAADDDIVNPAEVDYRETARFAKTDVTLRSRIRSWSGGLLEVVSARFWAAGKLGEDVWVQVIHQSVTDYILTRGLYTLAELAAYKRGDLDMSQSQPENVILTEHLHGELYSSCLQLLWASKDFLTDRPYLYSKWYPPKGSGHDSPFLEYADVYVEEHARKAMRHRSLDLEIESQFLEKVISIRKPAALLLGIDFRPRITRASSCLHFAVEAQLEDLIVYLTQNRANLNATDVRNRTPLHVAIRRGFIDTAKILVDAGSDLQVETEEGLTALSLAVDLGNLDFGRWLAARGARLDAHNGKRALNELVMFRRPGISPRDYRMQMAKLTNPKWNRGVSATGTNKFSMHHRWLVELCVEAGADIDAPDATESGTLLYAASLHGDEEVVDLLVEVGANVNRRQHDLGSALQAASWSGFEKVVRLLIEKGADVNLQGGDHGNALQTASCYCRESVVRMLLDAGANVNARGGFYGSALQAASRCGSTVVVQMLIDAGAKVNAQGGVYGSALNAAVALRHDDVERILRNAGATERRRWCNVM